VPGSPSAPDELAALRAANSRLREVVEAKDVLLAARDAQIAMLARQVESLMARVAELERRLGRESSKLVPPAVL
jgi:predicted  nucleic acid-binding Zn-ribbon protein